MDDTESWKKNCGRRQETERNSKEIRVQYDNYKEKKEISE